MPIKIRKKCFIEVKIMQGEINRYTMNSFIRQANYLNNLAASDIMSLIVIVSDKPIETCERQRIMHNLEDAMEVEFKCVFYTKEELVA